MPPRPLRYRRRYPSNLGVIVARSTHAILFVAGALLLGGAAARAGFDANVVAGSTFVPAVGFVKLVEGSDGNWKACTKYADAAAPTGGDGSYAKPFQKVQQLVNALGPGAVGCVRSGTYVENVRI